MPKNKTKPKEIMTQKNIIKGFQRIKLNIPAEYKFQTKFLNASTFNQKSGKFFPNCKHNNCNQIHQQSILPTIFIKGGCLEYKQQNFHAT